MTHTSVHYDEKRIDLCEVDNSSPNPDTITIHYFHYDAIENLVVQHLDDSKHLFSFPKTKQLTLNVSFTARNIPPCYYQSAVSLSRYYVNNGNLHHGVNIISTTSCVKRTVYDYNEYVTILLQGKKWGPLPASNEAMCALKREWWHEGVQCTTCSICLDDFEAGLEVTCMPCNHMFHEDCITEWLTENRLCPLCRSPLPHIVAT